MAKKEISNFGFPVHSVPDPNDPTKFNTFIEVDGKLYDPESDEYLKAIAPKLKSIIPNVNQQQLSDISKVSEQLKNLPPAKVGKQSLDQTKNNLRGKLFGLGLGGEKDIESRIDELAKAILNDEVDKVYPRYKDGFAFPFESLNVNIAPIIKEIQDQANQIIKVDELSEDIKSRQEGLAQENLKAQREGEISSFLSNLPKELGSFTQQFLLGEQQRAQKTLEEQLLPEILQGLNVRGLLTSGDLESELARAASEVQGTVNTEALELMKADSEFFQNAGYQNELRKSLSAGEDISSKVGFEREQSRATQERRFRSAQSGLDRALNERLFRKQEERALSSQREQERRRRDREERARERGIFENVARLGGTVVGASLGGPTGALFGSTAGETLTGMTT